MNAPDLHVHSMFSTYDGMGSVQAVVDRAVALDWGAVALTEHGWLGSAPGLYKAAKAAKIKPIIGCEMYVTPDEALVDGNKELLKERRHLTVLALNIEGYQNLVTWVNHSMQRPAYYNGPRISLDRMAEVAPHSLRNNVVLSGCLGGELCQCLIHADGNSELEAQLYIESCKSLFPNFYVELQNHWLPKFEGMGLTNYEQMCESQSRVLKRLLKLAQQSSVPVIVTNDSHYQTSDQRKPHIAMLARKSNAAQRQQSESFTHQYQYWTNYLRPMERIAATLPVWAEKESIESIHAIVEEANIVLDPLDKFSYALPRSAYDNPVAEVRRRCKSRLKSMVARHGVLAQERFDYELGAMESFADYLLIYSDIVRMARSQGIYTWTRGSAANSLVNYCLKIHEIDPIHYRLMFERFVNPARAKFPDVDIDIESHRQQDVVRMIMEYMEQIEGPNNVMPICTYSTLSNRNAFRMMAEAAGVPPERINELAKLLPQMIDSGMVDSEEEAYEALRDELGIDIHSDASAVFDAIGGVSQHACAFVLGTRERNLEDWVPNYRIGSSDTLVTQYNMKWIEELGFLKLDLLKLDTLSILHSVARMLGKDIDWLDTVAQSRPGIYDIDDPETFEMLRSGRTDGIHSMQGGSQRRGCIEVGVESDSDLVAIQALYRPSGTRTGLDKHFVDRRHGRENWENLNEITAKFLDETYGIAIYQEQIMEMGAHMGMSGEEIDDLYKAIKTAKGIGRGAKELFEAFEPTFRKYSKDLMPKEEADELWGDWERLQGYCVVGDTVVEKGDGTKVTVKELHDIWHGPITPLRKKYRHRTRKAGKGLWLTAWQDETIKLDRCIGIIDNGVKDVWTVKLADGKQITATANHPLLTEFGWTVVGQLNEDDDHVVVDTGEVAPYLGSPTDYTGLATVTQTLVWVCARCGSADGRLERAHLNHDRTDNSPGNVAILCNSCHKTHDYATGRRGGRWSRGRVAGLSKVVSVSYAGKQRTYDLAMEGDDHNFVANGIVAHNTFNRGHASSYAILALKTAWIKAHHPQMFFIALLERYPDNPRYIAAAIAEGFNFEPPDVNVSSGGFSRGSDDRSIRVGLLRIAGLGPGAVGEIVRNQPFASVDDIKERTNGQRVKAPTIQALAAVGALESLGIAGDNDDETDFRLLNFIPRRPVAFKGIKPKIGKRSGKWNFQGLQSGVDFTEGKSFCAKLFWVPENAPFATKSSATGKYNAHLLTVIDENGIPFDLIVSEDKLAESNLIKRLAQESGMVFCAEGQVVMPFMRGLNTGFRLWGITGAETDNPHIWHSTKEVADLVIKYARAKKALRRY